MLCIMKGKCLFICTSGEESISISMVHDFRHLRNFGNDNHANSTIGLVSTDKKGRN